MWHDKQELAEGRCWLSVATKRVGRIFWQISSHLQSLEVVGSSKQPKLKSTKFPQSSFKQKVRGRGCKEWLSLSGRQAGRQVGSPFIAYVRTCAHPSSGCYSWTRSIIWLCGNERARMGPWGHGGLDLAKQAVKRRRRRPLCTVLCGQRHSRWVFFAMPLAVN